MKFVITSDEIFALQNGGCSYLARVIYYEAIRPHMDFSTCIVGLARKISYRSISEATYIEPARGRHSSDAGAPSTKAIRTALESLEAAGLIERQPSKEKWNNLVFFLPKAHNGRVCPNDEVAMRGKNEGQDDSAMRGKMRGKENILATIGLLNAFTGCAANEGHDEGQGNAPMRGKDEDAMRGTPLGLHRDYKQGLDRYPLSPTQTFANQTHLDLGDSKNEPAAESTQQTRSKHAIPDWIDPITWHDYEEHRRAKKSPLVNGNGRHTIAKLEKLRAQGHDPNAVLAQSIERGWIGVFPLAHDHPGQAFDNSQLPRTAALNRLGPHGRATAEAAQRWLDSSEND
ncbi:hypothetical protein CCP4SC76_3420011 [Gammaproteobacteria bacterium]